MKSIGISVLKTPCKYRVGVTSLNILFSFAAVILLLMLMPYCTWANGPSITLEKLWKERYFNPQGIRMGQSMNDGIRYTIIENSTDLNIYEYETGNLLETLFTTRELLLDDEQQPIGIDTYAFNADESKLLIGVNQEAIYRHSRMAEYYIWDFTSQSLEVLSTNGKQRLPEFSPDGGKIAFVRENNIYMKNLATGQEYAVTSDGIHNEVINGTTDWVYEEEFGFTRGFFWSPNGRSIAFYRFDESNVKEFVMLRYGNLYPREDRFKYPKAGEENAKVTIHIYDVSSRKSTQVNTGSETDQYIPRIQWTQDPERLALLRLNRQQNHLEILLAEASSGKTDVLYSEKNEYYLSINDDLTFLKDGKHFIISSEKSGFNHLYLYDMKGSEVRALTSGQWDVQRFLGVDESSRLVYYLSHEESPLGNNLYSVRLNGRQKTKLTAGQGTNSPTFSKGYRFYINTYSTANTPPVYSIHRTDGLLVSVLQDNQSLVTRLGDFAYVDKEFFTITTSENIDLNAWIIKPADFDDQKQYPVLMFAYGGPDSQTVVNRWDAFNGIWFQMLAQMGYIVVSVDNRGTGARGEHFRKMTYQQLGKYETIDQIEAAQYLGQLPYIDAGRIAIFGWSYGGYLSSLCLAKGADYFAAAISVAPVTNWRFYDSIYTERYMRTPQENPDGYDMNSPVNHVDKIKGKLLLVHGSADDNVHYQNSMEMANALIEADVPFELMIYPDHNHSIFSGNARMHLYRKMTDFLNNSLMK